MSLRDNGMSARGRIILLAALALNLAFIFVHASLPPSLSGAEIDAVGGAVGSVLSEESSIGKFFLSNISNIAHFCEYGTLGVLCAIYLIHQPRGRGRLSVGTVAASALVGLLDETVQIFSGRHSSVADIWVDVLGFAACLSLLFGIASAVRAIKKRRCTHSSEKE